MRIFKIRFINNKVWDIAHIEALNEGHAREKIRSLFRDITAIASIVAL